MLTTGDAIGDFTVHSVLGAGDFATVYKVTRTESSDRTPHALKLSHSGDAGHSFRTQTEVECLSRFDHPGIPSLVDTGTHADQPYLVMEIAPGRSLRAILTSNTQINQYVADMRVLLILRSLLGVLSYLHSTDNQHQYGHGWAHRDIKDANVIVSDSYSRISLIDFGFCKEIGRDEKRTDDSFFRAGAPRYSPPSKHAYPTHARAEHDIFAVGVLAYQMLTNRFPWSVGSEEARGELHELMATTQPLPVAELNNTVRSPIADLITRLLDVEDEYRPSASTALEDVSGLIADLSSNEGGARSGGEIIHFPEDWRDPIYGDVRLTEFERRAIDTAELQRLRRIKQLGLTCLVFSGAEHTRLSHSVGCVYRVEQVLQSMEDKRGVRFSSETRLVARLYALVHDVTHICYGHTLEDEFGFFNRHDENRARVDRLVLSETSVAPSSVELR